MSAAAVIVLHESAAELERLLRSLERAAPLRLVVVDTGADDGGAALARAHGAEVIGRRDNPGFGAAVNAGIARVDAEITLLLNPDCEALDDSLARLAAIARAHPHALHAPRLLDPDGRAQRSAHPLPGTPGTLLGAAIHPRLLPRAVRERAEPHRAGAPRTVGWAIAACLAAATPTLRRLGPFDPAIHLFYEDMDLCLRARAQGIPTVLHPQLAVRHAGGHSVLRGGERFEALARRRRETIHARLGARARALDDAAQALTFATRAAARAALRCPNERERAQLAALARVRLATPAAAGRPQRRGPTAGVGSTP